MIVTEQTKLEKDQHIIFKARASGVSTPGVITSSSGEDGPFQVIPFRKKHDKNGDCYLVKTVRSETVTRENILTLLRKPREIKTDKYTFEELEWFIFSMK
jgi:topoisomerase IA-like protein